MCQAALRRLARLVLYLALTGAHGVIGELGRQRPSRRPLKTSERYRLRSARPAAERNRKSEGRWQGPSASTPGRTRPGATMPTKRMAVQRLAEASVVHADMLHLAWCRPPRALPASPQRVAIARNAEPFACRYNRFAFTLAPVHPFDIANEIFFASAHLCPYRCTPCASLRKDQSRKIRVDEDAASQKSHRHHIDRDRHNPEKHLHNRDPKKGHNRTSSSDSTASSRKEQDDDPCRRKMYSPPLLRKAILIFFRQKIACVAIRREIRAPPLSHGIPSGNIPKIASSTSTRRRHSSRIRQYARIEGER